jgi:glycosyltransferase involved in cell wall biosynthesis
MDQVIVVSHDAEANALGRATILADLLEPAFTVTIAAFGHRIWAPVATDSRIRLLAPPRSNLEIPLAARRLAAATEGAAALIAVKPRALSYGIACLVRHRRSLVLDIDDYEPAFVRRRLGWARQLLTPDHAPITQFLSRWRPRGLTVTVASRNLQRLYGGTWLPHVRERDGLRAEVELHRAQARQELGIATDTLVVGFVGTVRDHKGLPALAEAVARVDGAMLLVVGDTSGTRDEALFTRKAAGKLLLLPGPSLDDLGRALSPLDVVAIPQSTDITAKYQSPAKLLDAMAAGLPIVAGDSGDASELVGEGGILVPPGDMKALVAAIEGLRDPHLRASLGTSTFRRYHKEFRLPSWRPVFQHVVASAIEHAQRG